MNNNEMKKLKFSLILSVTLSILLAMISISLAIFVIHYNNYDDSQVDVQLNAPSVAVQIAERKYDNYIYDGNSYPYVVVSNSPNVSSSSFTVEYSLYGTSEWTTAPIDAGEYDVKITREADETYYAFVKIISKGLIINPKSIKIEVNDIVGGTVGYEYDKTPKSTTVSYTPMVNGSTLNCELHYALGENTNATDAGTWNVTIGEVTVINGKASNYEIDKTDVGIMVISQKEVDLSWSTLSEEQLIYDGNAKTLSATANNLIEGDACNVTVSLSENYDNVNVGNFTFTATSLTNANYKLPNSAISSLFSITAKPILFTINDVQSGVYEYNGRQHSTTATYTSLVGDDELEYILAYRKGTSIDAVDAGSWQVTIANAAITKGYSKNYQLETASASGLMIIDKKEITITIVDVEQNTDGYVYDKTPKSTTSTHNELVGNDTIEINLAYFLNGATYAIGAGSWQVTIANAMINSGDSDNYQINSSDVGSMVIAPKTVELEWTMPSSTSLVYDGKVKTPYATVTNLIGNDECDVTENLTLNNDNVNVGKFTFTATSLSNSNYKLPNNSISDDYIIEKRQLKVKAKNCSVTYGDKIENYELIYEGFVGDETISVIDVLPTVNSRYNDKTEVIHSGMKISVQSGMDNNYYFICTDGVITIAKKAITVTADNKTSIEGNKITELTYKSDGLIYGDSFIGSLTSDVDLTKAGIYTISQGSLMVNNNYKITFIGANYVVNAKHIWGNQDNGGISSIISTPNGVNPQSTFNIMKVDANAFDWFEIPEGSEVVGAYKTTLSLEFENSANYTIKINAPSGAGNISAMKVIVYENGQAVTKTLRLEGDYLSFTTDSPANFVIVQTRTNPMGLIAVFIIIGVLFAAFSLWYLIKRRRDYNEYKF